MRLWHRLKEKLMKRINKSIIFDFDSTLVKIEGLEVLAEIALSDNPKRSEIIQEISSITNLGMLGKIDFKESLMRRLSLFNITKNHIEKLNEQIISTISDSILENKEFFKINSENIFIVSGGFKEWIFPVSDFLGISRDNVFANTFKFSGENYSGIDENNKILMKKGKARVVEALNLSSESFIVGDGFTDYEIKGEGFVDKFVLYTENVLREDLATMADFVVSDFGEILELLATSH